MYHKYTGIHHNAALLLSIALLLQLTFMPNAYAQNLNRTNKVNWQAGSFAMNQSHSYPFLRYDAVYLMEAYKDKELFDNTGVNYIIGRSLKDFYRLSYRLLFAVILPMLSFGMVLLHLSSYHKKGQRRLPVMAASLGGHAPPAGLFSYFIERIL